MRIDIVSIFPEIFEALNYGVVGRAISQKKIRLSFWNPRDFSQDKHKRVDDRPYGGGPGMVMKVQPLRDAIIAAKMANPHVKVIYVSPQGQSLTQAHVSNLALEKGFILLNGRYEGIDERLINGYVDAEYSIGDYVISGGEFASLILIDAIARCIPSVLGNQRSFMQDSFSDDRLDYPHYTRPDILEDVEVPAVLRNGDHKLVADWRKLQSLLRTQARRPDLFVRKPLTAEEKALLDQQCSHEGEKDI